MSPFRNIIGGISALAGTVPVEARQPLSLHCSTVTMTSIVWGRLFHALPVVRCRAMAHPLCACSSSRDADCGWNSTYHCAVATKGRISCIACLVNSCHCCSCYNSAHHMLCWRCLRSFLCSWSIRHPLTRRWAFSNVQCCCFALNATRP